MSGLGTFFKGFKKTFTNSHAWTKITSNLKTATNGSRAWPTDKSQDKAIGARFDWGELHVGSDGREKRILYMQPNASANNVAVKKKAQQGTHQNLAVVPVDVKNPPTEEEFLKAVKESLNIWDSMDARAHIV